MPNFLRNALSFSLPNVYTQLTPQEVQAKKVQQAIDSNPNIPKQQKSKGSNKNVSNVQQQAPNSSASTSFQQPSNPLTSLQQINTPSNISSGMNQGGFNNTPKSKSTKEGKYKMNKNSNCSSSNMKAVKYKSINKRKMQKKSNEMMGYDGGSSSLGAGMNTTSSASMSMPASVGMSLPPMMNPGTNFASSLGKMAAYLYKRSVGLGTMAPGFGKALGDMSLNQSPAPFQPIDDNAGDMMPDPQMGYATSSPSATPYGKPEGPKPPIPQAPTAMPPQANRMRQPMRQPMRRPAPRPPMRRPVPRMASRRPVPPAGGAPVPPGLGSAPQNMPQAF